MRFAYADPPYLGCSKFYDHPETAIWDDPDTHRDLFDRLQRDYPDGWAVSASAPSLRTLMPFSPPETRLCIWTKPFASFKPNVRLAYTWEPVFLLGGRKRGRDVPTVRDHLSAVITLQRGLTGAKPAAFCEWILDLLGFDHTQDSLDDLFPGTGIMGQVIAGRKCEAHVGNLFSA